MLSKLTPRTIFTVIAAAVFGRLSTAVAQLAAAFYLTPDQFGLYATAVGVVIATSMFRGGGTGNHMLTMTPAEFQDHGGRMFRYSLMFAALCTVLSIAVAGPTSALFAAAKGYSQQDLQVLIIVLGIQFSAFVIGQYPRARMAAESAFKELSLMDSFSGVLKVASTWILASRGFGAMALAAPLLVTICFENLWTWIRADILKAEMRVQRGWFRLTLRELRLPLVCAVLATLNGQTDALIGSAMIPVSVIGYYFFATQLATQPNTVIASSLRAVFSSAIAHVRGDAKRERESMHAVFASGMVFAPMISMALPAVFGSFEHAVWNGKWSESRYPLLILSATMVYPTVAQLVAAPLAAMRDWGTSIRLDSTRAAAKIVGAAIGGAIVVWKDLGVIQAGVVLATAVGGLTALVCAYELYRVMLRSGLPRSTILYELYSSPLACALSSVAAGGLAHSFIEPLRSELPARAAAGIECVVAALLYTVLVVILLRFGYTRTLERVTEALPSALQKLARRVFVLNA